MAGRHAIIEWRCIMHGLIFAMAMTLIVAVLWYFLPPLECRIASIGVSRVITCPETCAAAAPWK